MNSSKLRNSRFAVSGAAAAATPSAQQSVMDSALHVDDAVPAAERLTGLADQIKGVSDLAVIVGMFVGQHHFGGRGD